MAKEVAFGEYYTVRKQKDGSLMITGYDPAQTVGVGSLVFLGLIRDGVVGKIEKIERRNHAGVFKNHPQNSINSFYKAR